MRLFTTPKKARVLAFLALIGLVMAAYTLWARPYQLHWGATNEEVKQAIPGDESNPHLEFFATRAITIAGTPEEIWPWLVQMGYGRVGYYGYDILENLGSPQGIRSADRILLEFEHFTVGDGVPISPVADMVFHAIEPDRYIIWAGKTGVVPSSFTWALYPLDAGHTRLASRIRWSYHLAQPGLLTLDLFTEFTDHLAVRKILQGVKGRVENQIKPMAQQNIEFAVYVLAALIFLATLLLSLIRPLAWGRWLVGLAGGSGMAHHLVRTGIDLERCWVGASCSLGAARCIPPDLYAKTT